jgi:hypothetical protein
MWKTSSYCCSGECVECVEALLEAPTGSIVVRNSNDPDGRHLYVPAAAWAAVTAAVRKRGSGISTHQLEIAQARLPVKLLVRHSYFSKAGQPNSPGYCWYLSTDPDAELFFSAEEWQTWCQGVENGEFFIAPPELTEEHERLKKAAAARGIEVS